MARIVVDAEQTPEGRKGFNYNFIGSELKEASIKQHGYHLKRMDHYHQVFLEELKRSLPDGMTMDRGKIDIEHFDIQSFATTYSTSTVMRGDSEEARGAWHRHRTQAQEFLRHAMLFRRDEAGTYCLTFDDVVYFGLFDIHDTSLVD